MTQAVPALQSLLPNPDCVMKEPGCVCFLRPNNIQNTTKNPVTERKRVAWVNLGTDLGDRNSGAAFGVVSVRSTAKIEVSFPDLQVRKMEAMYIR